MAEHPRQTCVAGAMEQIPGTALAAWARRVLNEPLPDDSREAGSYLPPLEEWSRRWHALTEFEPLPAWGPGSTLELELLDGVIDELRRIASDG